MVRYADSGRDGQAARVTGERVRKQPPTPTKDQIQMDKILIKNLLLRGIIGINPEERVKKQDILINVVMWASIAQAAATDDIQYAVNYKSITKRIIEHVEASQDYLVEKLVTDIARLIFEENTAVQKVQVRVEKPGALRFAESVGIEIERTRADVE